MWNPCSKGNTAEVSGGSDSRPYLILGTIYWVLQRFKDNTNNGISGNPFQQQPQMYSHPLSIIRTIMWSCCSHSLSVLFDYYCTHTQRDAKQRTTNTWRSVLCTQRPMRCIRIWRESTWRLHVCSDRGGLGGVHALQSTYPYVLIFVRLPMAVVWYYFE